MPGNFYHSAPIPALYPNSYYSIDGLSFLLSGDGKMAVKVLDSNQTQIIYQNSFDCQINRIVDFRFIFQTQSQYSNPVLMFSHIGSYGTNILFDNIYFGISRAYNEIGVIQIYPEWDMKRFTVQNREDHRTRGGKMFSYKWGDYERLEVPIEYISDSKAAIINSWWATDALIYFKIYSGGVWQVNTCYLMNDGAPFDIHPKPYDQYFNGRLELETF